MAELEVCRSVRLSAGAVGACWSGHRRESRGPPSVVVSPSSVVPDCAMMGGPQSSSRVLADTSKVGASIIGLAALIVATWGGYLVVSHHDSVFFRVDAPVRILGLVVAASWVCRSDLARSTGSPTLRQPPRRGSPGTTNTASCTGWVASPQPNTEPTTMPKPGTVIRPDPRNRVCTKPGTVHEPS